MSNCSQHKKEVAGISDMKELAEMIGDLHYESLTQLLYNLSKKIDADSVTDFRAGREKLASDLQYFGMSIFESALRSERIWQRVKPFMSDESETE